MRKDFLKLQLHRNPWLMGDGLPPLNAGDFYEYEGRIGKVTTTQTTGFFLQGHAIMPINDWTRPNIRAALIDDKSFEVCTICEEQFTAGFRLIPLRIDGNLKLAVATACPECAIKWTYVPIRSEEYEG